MELYNIIAENYSEIFPLSEERINFVKKYMKENSRLLDIGSATGDLCIELSRAGYRTCGIDLNSGMIKIARKKAEKENLQTEFQIMDMREIDKHFDNNEFSIITCFGNTLPHLDDSAEISGFFKAVYSLLEKNGIFVFQILNYDKILREKSCAFPVIEKPGFTFKRQYFFYDDKINFNIEIETKDGKLSDSTALFPVKRDQVFSLLIESGLRHKGCYSDYNLRPYTGNEFSVLYTAEK